MIKELTSDFPGNLLCGSVPATGHIDTLTFVIGVDREIGAGDRPVPRGCPVLVEGWAFDPDCRGGADVVVVTINGDLGVRAETRRRRPDVARSFERAELETAGWLAKIPTDELPPGRYDVNFHVIDEARASYYTANDSRVFELGSPIEGVPRLAPGRMKFSIDAVRVESARHAEAPERKIPECCVVLVEGWVVDAKLEALAGDVYVAVDQRTIDRGLYGYDRPNAVLHFKTPMLLASGFKARFQTRALIPGTHSFHIIAVSADGSAYDESDEERFEIVAEPDAATNGTLTSHPTTACIEQAFSLGPGGVEPHIGSIRLAQGQNLHLSGWAIDEPNRSAGFDAALLVDESMLFAAFYGAPRNDIADMLGSADFRDCGFVGAVSTTDLAPGIHAVRCLVRSNDGASWLLGSQQLEFEIMPARQASSGADPHRTGPHPR